MQQTKQAEEENENVKHSGYCAEEVCREYLGHAHAYIFIHPMMTLY